MAETLGRAYCDDMKMLLRTILTATLFGVTASSASQAGDNAVLVELFTSQGCSSCPPADRNLGDLAGREDVLPLSLHVDYWDYLGWRDTFASRAHTERQYAYRELLGARVVYTPQIIVHGTADVPGYRPDLIGQAIEAAGSAPRKAGIAISTGGGMLKAAIRVNGPTRPCTIWMATYRVEASVAIERGENAGRTITYHNVVEKLMRVGPWQGGTEQSLDLPQPRPGEGVAIWLQDDATGQVLSASFHEG